MTKYTLVGIVVLILAGAGYFYFYWTPFSFSNNGGTSLEDAIIITASSNSYSAKSVIDKGIIKYLHPYNTMRELFLNNRYLDRYSGYGIRGISDFIAQNGRRYIRILEESGNPPTEYRVFYFDVTDILKNKAKAYQNTVMGGDGSSLDIPVVLSNAMADDLDAAEKFMYQHIDDVYGTFGKDWQYVSDSTFQGNPDTNGLKSWGTYKKVNIKLSDGSEKSVYFEITEISNQ